MVHGMTDEEFTAWCEWRKWCSVWRVKDPQATQEELDRGLLDDKTPAERKIHYDYLYGFVSGILKKWVSLWYKTYKSGARVTKNQQDELISVFDEYMKSGKKKDLPVDFTGTSYKDYVFYQISQSSDPPGQVLIGKIFGNRGYIRAIVARYLMETEQLARGPKNGILLFPGTKSMDEELDEESEKTLHDKLQGDDRPELDESKEIAKLFRELDFTREEKLALWAVSHGVAISNPELCEVLHCKKEKAKNTLDSAINKLKTHAPDLLEAEALAQILKMIFLEMEAENEAHTFLYGIVNREGGDVL